MRSAMAEAEVGDDQFGEDPSVIRLQELVAGMLGKEAALWLPTGTMANQVALRVATRPGDDVIVARESHAMWHEAGAAGANAGIQFTELGSMGIYRVDEFRSAIKPRGHMIYPPTTMVQVEDTHNRAGGVVFPHEEAVAICDLARTSSITSYLDGARLFNAALAGGRNPAQVAGPFDLVSVSLSKGLGAPGGSVMAGTRPTIDAAVRFRRMSGGAMRQVGIFAAAGIHALEHNLDRLVDDHANARLLGERLAQSEHVILDPATVRTNILVFGLDASGPDAPTVVERARERGVLILAFGPRTIRAVTHLDVSSSACAQAADILLEVVAAS
jgi:threonine aldolase